MASQIQEEEPLVPVGPLDLTDDFSVLTRIAGTDTYDIRA